MAFFWRKKQPKGTNYREQIVTAARRLYDKNILAATDGNISSKENESQILITPSGRQKAFLRPEEIILHNIKEKNPNITLLDDHRDWIDNRMYPCLFLDSSKIERKNLIKIQ